MKRKEKEKREGSRGCMQAHVKKGRQVQEKAREDEEKGEGEAEKKEELERSRGCMQAHVQKGKTKTREIEGR